PQRYIGNEWNVVKKSHSGRVSFCFCYPDLYEIGMSNLGTHIVYGLLNRNPDFVCERSFMPAEDLANYLKTSKIPLFSLETKTALHDFEVLGFHLGCELNFTNVLHMLALGGVEIFSAERKDLIVLGGGIVNPEPLAEFIDVFYLGEFEEVADRFIEIFHKYKDKSARLKALAETEGFYVPAFYQASRQADQYVFEQRYSYARLPQKRVAVKDLNRSFVPEAWLTAHTEIIHDRIPIEIARGCPNACSFCQARAVYTPYRQRQTATVINILQRLYQGSGSENFSFLALSASDHSEIEELIDAGLDYCRKRRIGLSLPSLRASDIVGRLYKKLSSFRKASLTVAIEAARQPLREALNKKIDLGVVFEAAKILQSLGLRQIKIYFMYGFPQETDEDLLAIGEFLDDLYRRSRLKLRVSLNVFIPKPFSLWQAKSILPEDILRRRQDLILRNLPRQRGVSVSFSSIERSLFEALVSRAGREFGKVLYLAYSRGVCFDGSRENFSFGIWKELMEEAGFDYRRCLEEQTANFPWSFIE
ncbi:MAG: TIGR03960 family B12-binding radical SAM protein, partial [Candidatus Omnitrophica bacterium]|nr:TIGR03960 family B12-binding radical SAM protein [Candidatus Omnitrophota bacterium]